jgi:hypothetical protein
MLVEKVGNEPGTLTFRPPRWPYSSVRIVLQSLEDGSKAVSQIVMLEAFHMYPRQWAVPNTVLV